MIPPVLASVRRLTGLLSCALLASAPLAATAGPPAAVLIHGGPPNPSVTAPQLNTPSAAGWSCGHEKCAYVKANGTKWANCFQAWSPTHRGWRPTNYCH